MYAPAFERSVTFQPVPDIRSGPDSLRILKLHEPLQAMGWVALSAVQAEQDEATRFAGNNALQFLQGVSRFISPPGRGTSADFASGDHTFVYRFSMAEAGLHAAKTVVSDAKHPYSDITVSYTMQHEADGPLPLAAVSMVTAYDDDHPRLSSSYARLSVDGTKLDGSVSLRAATGDTTRRGISEPNEFPFDDLGALGDMAYHYFGTRV